MSNTPNGHIDDEQMELYILGRVTGDAARRVDLHLLVCQACQHAYKQERQRIEEIKRALKKADEESDSRN